MITIPAGDITADTIILLDSNPAENSGKVQFETVLVTAVGPAERDNLNLVAIHFRQVHPHGVMTGRLVMFTDQPVVQIDDPVAKELQAFHAGNQPSVWDTTDD